MTDIHVEYTLLSQVQRAPRNPRTHDIPAIRKSLREFGFTAPVLIDETTGRLVAGHGRLEALMEEHAEGGVPPKRIKVNESGEWLVPVVRGVDFKDERDAERYLITDNRLTELGTWDDAELHAMLKESSDAGMIAPGWTDAQVTELLAKLAEPPKAPAATPGLDVIAADIRALARPISALHEDVRNARQHPERSLEAITASLRAFGQQKPIVIKSSGEVVAGNGTFRAAVRLGWTHVAAIVFDAKAGDTVGPERERRFALADNRTAELSEWDDAVLASGLREMLDQKIDMREIGWNTREISKLLDSIAEKDEDSGGTAPGTDLPRTKTGDIWICGRHRVMCGDASSEDDVARLFGSAKTALVVTDPPYGIGYDTNKLRIGKRGGWDPIEGDGVEESPKELIVATMSTIQGRVQEGCAVFVCSPPGELNEDFRAALYESSIHVLKTLIWAKPMFTFGRHEYHWRHELIFYGWFKGSRARFIGDRNETTVWEIAPSEDYQNRGGSAQKLGGLGLHPTQKPVELFARCIRNHTELGEVVYDPFAGSGSLVIAAENLGRRALAMEIDRKYVDTIVRRWEQHIGNTAVKETPEE